MTQNSKFIVCNDQNKNEDEKKKWIEAEKKRVKAEIKQRMVALHTNPVVIKSEPSDLPQVDASAHLLPNLLPDTSDTASGPPPSKLGKS